ncbi:MAG: hypothetical protein NVS3B26_14510 [Mycobacteriales bacterium]
MSEQALRPGALRSVSVGRAVATSLLAGLVVLGAVALLLSLAQRRTATAEAIRDARTLTNLEATDVVGPALSDDSLVAGTPAAGELDRIVRQRVLGPRIVRVKIWDPSGQIVYSDDRSLIGARFALAADERAAVDSRRISAQVSNLNGAENRDERQFGKLLQVYQGVSTRTGRRLLFETYQPYTVISQSTRRMLMSTLPVLLAGLLLLYLVQAPLAYRMARRLKASQDEREGLLLAALAASDRERAAIAADLHDGVVQGLTGASFSLTAGAARTQGLDPAGAQTMANAAADLRRWVRELRSLVVTITPPALHAQGLGVSLTDLAATLEARGIDVRVHVTGDERLSETVEALVFRAGQEAVRNIVRHADARNVAINVERQVPGLLTLTVTDDGRGFDSSDRTARRRGSVGLDLLASLVAAQGGTMTVDGARQRGTTLHVRLPVPVSPETTSAPMATALPASDSGGIGATTPPTSGHGAR